MPVSCLVDSTLHIGCLRCTDPSSLDDLKQAVTKLLLQADFNPSFGILLEVDRDTEFLTPTHASHVVELLVNHGEALHGPTAVCVTDMAEFTSGRLIVMLGRYRGACMEAFRDRPAALRWLVQRSASTVTNP